jgi:hypothetical protein
MKIQSSKKYAFLGLLIVLPTLASAMDLQNRPLIVDSKSDHPLIPRKSYQCDRCLDIFFSLKTLSEHNHAMHPIPPRPLSVCIKKYAITKQKNRKAVKSKKNALPKKIIRKKHNATTCTECGKQCKSDYFLLLHMREHTGEKLPACRICKRQFSYKANRDRHEKEVHKK